MSFRRRLVLLFCGWLFTGALALALSCSSTSGGPADSSSGTDAGVEADAPHVEEHRGSLTELSVVSLASHAVTLTPAFSPGIHDYYVRCAAETNQLEVKISASTGAMAQLKQPVVSKLRAKQTIDVGVPEGAAIVVVVTDDNTNTEYWVRCLPHDFPVLEWTPHRSAGTPPPGYYMVANSSNFGPGEAGYAMVLDSHGVPLWYHAAPSGTPNYYDVETLTPGTISFVSSNYLVPYTFFQLSPWKVTPVGMLGEDDHHDMAIIYPGRYLVFHMPTLEGVDLSALTVPLPDGGVEHLGTNETVHGCWIYEIDDAGTIYWDWKAEEHLVPNEDTVYPEIVGTASNGKPIVGVYHCNALGVDHATGNFTVSMRNLDSFMYIEKATKKILWKIGGKSFTNDGAQFIPVADAFHRQHDARFHSWTPECGGAAGHGEVTMFDDESGEPSVARGVLYDVTIGHSSCPTSPGPSDVKVLWQYNGTVTSNAFGSFRILPDGSHIIGWGGRFTQPLTFTEVDEKGHDLLDFAFDPGTANTSYRAIKAPLSAFELSALRHTAGM